MKYCPKCNNEHSKTGRFCSPSCANSRERSPELRKRLSDHAKSNPSGNVLLKQYGNAVYRTRIQRQNIACYHCGTNFQCKITENKKYCSSTCRRHNAGGLRIGSGRGKSGYYSGFYLSSTYELAYLIYNLDHNILIERNKKYWVYQYNGKTHKFYPDFRVARKLIEIKSFRSDLTDSKIAAVTEPIDVLYGTELAEIFQYVENKTGLKISKLYSLYELE